jgi:hypothetical protein
MSRSRSPTDMRYRAGLSSPGSGVVSKKCCPLRAYGGTEGSNPSPSTSESAANPTSSIRRQSRSVVSLAGTEGSNPASSTGEMVWDGTVKRADGSAVNLGDLVETVNPRPGRIWLTMGGVAEKGAGWRWRCTSNSSDYSGCPADCCAEGGSRPAARRCSVARIRRNLRSPSSTSPRLRFCPLPI